MKHIELTVRVRYQETDQMGFVYYSNYFVYFEMGRIEFLRKLGFLYSELEKENIFLAVIDAHCKYKSPARFDDLLTIKTWLSKLKPARIEFHYEIIRKEDEKLIAEGSTTLACLGENRRPRGIPDEIRNTITSKNLLPVSDQV